MDDIGATILLAQPIVGRAGVEQHRAAIAQGVGDLGRELPVVRPYLEILKARMEERLHTVIDVPDGLLSA